jgi:hypothetical protein
MGLHRIDWVATATVLSLLFAVACGGGDDSKPAGEAAPPTAGPEIPQGETQIQMPTSDGTPELGTITQGEIPKDLPADIPTFPSAKAATSMLIPGRGGLVTFSSDSDVADIVSFYKDALPEQGWKIENVSEADLRTRITATKEGRKTDIVAARNGDSTEILISLREQE